MAMMVKELVVPDKYVKEKGYNKLNLHVFSHNEVAISLYKKMGYSVSGLSMTKTIQ